MKNLPVALFFLLFFSFNSIQLFSQEKEKKTYKTNITLSAVPIVFREIRLGYERQLTERHTLRTSVGVKIPSSSESFGTFNPLPLIIPLSYQVSNGGYLSFGYNYVFSPRKKLYLSAETYLSYYYYNDKYFKLCVGTSMDSYVALQSGKLMKTGLKFLIGKKIAIISKGKVGLQLDIFAGFGGQYRDEEITIYKKKKGTCSITGTYHEFQEYDPPEIETSKNWYPTLHAGLLLGMPF